MTMLFLVLFFCVEPLCQSVIVDQYLLHDDHEEGNDDNEMMQSREHISRDQVHRVDVVV